MSSLGIPFGQMSVRQIQDGLAAQEFSCQEMAEAALTVIGEEDREVHAFLELTRDNALAQAQAIDQQIAQGAFSEGGALRGVPMGYKDNLHLEGTHTTCSSAMLGT